eukprot:TRINITY_DN15165_c0_g1_i1.p1 TRINITY_DN15165_c0_g1~~TRINITY_DN15165_c0_g1_i1.p1  ORF type:complete len:780 (-),score=87.30 TRINITY_DN15165_c0_g1_i1:147-2369(-)
MLKGRTIYALELHTPGAEQKNIKDAHELVSKLKPDGSWSDINYKDRSRALWDPSKHYERLFTIVRAVRTLNATQQNKKELEHFTKATHSALGFWFSKDPHSANWWWNQINEPQKFAYIGLLFQPWFQGDEKDWIIKIVTRANPKGWSGANLLWLCGVQINRGLLTDDFKLTFDTLQIAYKDVKVQKRLLEVTSRPHQQVEVPVQGGEAGDGIQPDFSFHQHGPELEQGSYGSVFVGSMLTFIGLTTGIPSFQIPPKQMAVFVSLLLDGDQWMLIGNKWDWQVTGREVTRPSTGIGGPDWNTTAIRRIPLRNKELNQFANRLENKAAPAFIGNKHFFCSDYMMHRRPGWAVSIHMRSNRTIPSRCVNDECKTCQHYSDGTTVLHYNGLEQSKIFPLWNWQQLPGITCEQNPKLLQKCTWQWKQVSKGFVGGVSNGVQGAAAMDLVSDNIHVHNSWFLFNDSFVSFQNILERKSSNPVYTNIINRHVPNPATATEQVYIKQANKKVSTIGTVMNQTFTDVQWLYYNHTAYLFYPRMSTGDGAPAQFATLYITRAVLSGNWYTIGVSKRKDSEGVLTVNFDQYYGEKIPTQIGGSSSAPMAYHIVVPALKDQTDAATAWENHANLDMAPPSANTQAVCNQGVVGGIFWSGSSVVQTSGSTHCSGVTSVGASDACMVMVQQNSTGWTVTASNPDVGGLQLTVSVGGVSAKDTQTCHQTKNGLEVKISLPTGQLVGASAAVHCPA